MFKKFQSPNLKSSLNIMQKWLLGNVSLASAPRFNRQLVACPSGTAFHKAPEGGTLRGRSRNIPKRHFFLIICCLVIGISYLEVGVSSLRAETIDRIVAVVNGEIITASEVDKALLERQRSLRSAGGLRAEEMRRGVIDRLIDEILLMQSIEKARITVDDNDIARAIQNVLRQNNISIEQLRKDIAAKDTSFETYKRQLADQIRLIKFTNQVIGQQVKLSEREVREFFENNKERFGTSNFEAVKETVYDIVYEEKVQEALKNHLLKQRQKAYIDIK